jgi:hypothetical protein
MTLEKLLGGSADYLESLSNEELKAFFAKYLPTTRPSPEQEKSRKAPAVKKSSAPAESPMDKARRLYREKFGKELDI